MIQGSLEGKEVAVVKSCPVPHNFASDRTERTSAADKSFERLHRCDVRQISRLNLSSNVLTMLIPSLID